LAVAALYEDDSALCEWVEHYMLEGADRFYIGTVGLPTEVALANIRRYHSKVTHIQLAESQDRGNVAANTASFLILAQAAAIADRVEWLAVVQMDDFVTTRKYVDDRLVDTLPIYDNTPVAVVYYPWLIFGSSGLEDTPASVISSFTNRMNMSNHLPRSCTSCMCTGAEDMPRRHDFGDGYLAKPSLVHSLEPFVAIPKRAYLAVNSMWDPLEEPFVPGPDGTESYPGYRGWVSSPVDHTVVSHKYFYQAREHWVRVKCAGTPVERALESFTAGDAVANSNADTLLKRKRDSRMKHLHPKGARLLMDYTRRCLSWQTHPADGEY